MDYQFSRDIYGNAQAKLSMGHEAFARFLSEEVAHNSSLCQKLFNEMQSITQGSKSQFIYTGQDFELYLDRQKVEVSAHTVNHSFDDFPIDNESIGEADFYDQEHQAECGFEDFRHLLEAWLEYITYYT